MKPSFSRHQKLTIVNGILSIVAMIVGFIWMKKIIDIEI